MEERIEDQNGIIALGKKELGGLQEEYERFDAVREAMGKDREILVQKGLDAEDQIFGLKRSVGVARKELEKNLSIYSVRLFFFENGGFNWGRGMRARGRMN